MVPEVVCTPPRLEIRSKRYCKWSGNMSLGYSVMNWRNGRIEKVVSSVYYTVLQPRIIILETRRQVVRHHLTAVPSSFRGESVCYTPCSSRASLLSRQGRKDGMKRWSNSVNAELLTCKARAARRKGIARGEKETNRGHYAKVIAGWCRRRPL